jgi:hypothetical protein
VDRLEPTREELLQRLDEQRRFLAVSCAAFDAGDQAEGKRLASTLTVLLHDLARRGALLAQLGTRDEIEWLDTAGSILPLVAGAQTPLVVLGVDLRLHRSRSSWLPTLDGWDRRLQERPQLSPDAEATLARMRTEGSLRSRGSWLPFAEWWNADVLRDTSGLNFTRAGLVEALANTDDDAHEDPRLELVHRRLTKPDATGWATKLEPGLAVPLLSPALASVRQLAFEVERSLHRALAATPAAPSTELIGRAP